jgi:hypothetical protein
VVRITGDFQQERVLHPAAISLAQEFFTKGWPDPAKLNNSSRQASILQEQVRQSFAKALNVRSDEVEFLGEPDLGFQLAIQGLLTPDNKLFYSSIDRQRIFAVAAYEKNKGRSLYVKMIDLYMQYGMFKEDLISITKKGMNGAAEISQMMQGYRENPPSTIDGVAVTELLDYELQIGKNLQTGKSWTIDLPKSNVLQFVLTDRTKISARPSGTEPKIKFYFSVNTTLEKMDDFSAAENFCNDKIARIVNEMDLK